MAALASPDGTKMAELEERFTTSNEWMSVEGALPRGRLAYAGAGEVVWGAGWGGSAVEISTHLMNPGNHDVFGEFEPGGAGPGFMTWFGHTTWPAGLGMDMGTGFSHISTKNNEECLYIAMRILHGVDDAIEKLTAAGGIFEADGPHEPKMKKQGKKKWLADGEPIRWSTAAGDFDFDKYQNDKLEEAKQKIVDTPRAWATVLMNYVIKTSYNIAVNVMKNRIDKAISDWMGDDSPYDESLTNFQYWYDQSVGVGTEFGEDQFSEHFTEWYSDGGREWMLDYS